jgi:hypothetical protein
VLVRGWKYKETALPDRVLMLEQIKRPTNLDEEKINGVEKQYVVPTHQNPN